MPTGTHRVGKFFTKGLKIERMTTGHVVRTATRVVIEVSGPYHAKPFVQGLQVRKERHPPRSVRELVGVEKVPPDVLVWLGLGHIGNEVVHVAQAQVLIVSLSRK